ncbi:MAG: glycosyltransferase [Chthoniobacterales bacterium]
MKICDVTQFYAPRSGGVKRYLHAKIDYLQQHSLGDEHVLIVPGARTEKTANGSCSIHTIASPLVSRSTGYRALLNLRAVNEVIEREQPDIIESADPYQLGWKLAATAKRRLLPAVAFYHSGFGEAYLRPRVAPFGGRAANATMRICERYVQKLYNRFEVTFVPSEELAVRLRGWGVRDVRVVELGVDTDVFNPGRADTSGIRAELGVLETAKLLIYVGRLAAEKNTSTLFAAFEILARRRPGSFHLLVVGDGQQRTMIDELRAKTNAVTWLAYCSEATRLAQLYRAADLFVHPGTQETFGLVALEAQACGTPVVGIRGSAMDRIILHDQSAWALENSPDTFADAIERTASLDLHALGATASKLVAQRYSWRRVFDRLFCIYREVCAEYAATR